MVSRRPRILHCTSEPLVFFGRHEELTMLDRALAEDTTSVVALIGPGGQGKTAIVQHWLHRPSAQQTAGSLHLPVPVDGLFFWSFYRGRDVDLCLREWLAYAEGLPAPPEVAGSWCVERLLAVLRRERWAVVLDGAEVVQYEDGPWRGRFVHPDLGRLLEELASEPLPGVVVLTTRFELPTLQRRPHARLVGLERLDPMSARQLLQRLGVHGTEEQLDAVADRAGRHAKAVELLGTLLAHFHAGQAASGLDLVGHVEQADVEESVSRVLAAYRRALSEEAQDLLALATTFREPPRESLLLDYLASPAVATLLHRHWGRTYPPFGERPSGWLAQQIDELIRLRLLERVGQGSVPVIDAHPLVRRGFEHAAGQQTAASRAGFLRGRPDRRRAANLSEAGEAIEQFHAFCDAGLWVEADSALAALENPKHRFLAPALERDLLLRFFPEGDWRKGPIWPGFGRWRSLAICLEMLGQFDEALEVYRPQDAALAGDALLALGRLEPLLRTAQMSAPWQTLWQCYRCHALCLAGQVRQALAVAGQVIPVDIYEWVHVFECLLRAGQLHRLDRASLQAGQVGGSTWGELARRRLLADYRRIVDGPVPELEGEYRSLLQAYDRAGLPVERVLTRLSQAAWLGANHRLQEAIAVNTSARILAEQLGLPVLQIDALEQGDQLLAQSAQIEEFPSKERVALLRKQMGIHGPVRP